MRGWSWLVRAFLIGVAVFAVAVCDTKLPVDVETSPGEEQESGDGPWVDFMNEQPGITVLPENPMKGPERAPRIAVQAEGEAAVRGLVEALETETTPGPDDSAVVTIVVGEEGARSMLRFVPHHTAPEAVETLLEPVEAPIVERIIGQRSRHPRFVDQGPEDFESFPTVVHFAEGDLVDAARAVVAPEGFSTEVIMRDSGNDEDSFGWASVDHPTLETTAADVHALADDLALARELPEPPVSMTGTSLTFDSREAVLAAAEALPESITATLSHQGPVIGTTIGPTAMFDDTPTRADLIAFAKDHPEAVVGDNIERAGIHFEDIADCQSFLTEPPQWTSAFELSCGSPSGKRVVVEHELPVILEAMPVYLDSIRGDGRIVRRMDDSMDIIGGENLDQMIRVVRQIGWEGESAIRLQHGTADKVKVRAMFRSTEDGPATEVRGRRYKRMDEVIAMWDATAS